MELRTAKLTDAMGHEILNWEYVPPYDYYNSSATEEGMKELLENPYYALLDSYDRLAGFFCVGASAQVPIGRKYGFYPEGFIDIGLGMHPALTGMGNGFAFFSHILNYLEEEFPGLPARLTVAAFNERAIRLYQKAGFHETNRFYNETVEFIVMVKE